MRDIASTMESAVEVLADCRRYLTEFGSIEPSGLVFRIDGALRDLRQQKDEQCYLWQLATVNAARVKRGEQPLTYSEFSAGSDQ